MQQVDTYLDWLSTYMIQYRPQSRRFKTLTHVRCCLQDLGHHLCVSKTFKGGTPGHPDIQARKPGNIGYLRYAKGLLIVGVISRQRIFDLLQDTYLIPPSHTFRQIGYECDHWCTQEKYNRKPGEMGATLSIIFVHMRWSRSGNLRRCRIILRDLRFT